MKKLLGAVVAGAALMLSGLANAAPVDIIYYSDSPTNGSSINQLTLRVDAGISVGYVSLVLDGATAFTPAAAPVAISTADSVLDAAAGFVIIVSPAGVAMVQAGGATSIGTLTFTSRPGPCGGAGQAPCSVIRQDIDLLGPAVLDINGAEVASSISIVPEPSTLALLGLGLAGLAFVRRAA